MTGKTEKRRPERTCIACRRKGEPECFFRIAGTADGSLELFDRKCSTGRSAYICRAVECVEKALAKDRLARALKKPVSEAAKAQGMDLLICKLR